MYGQFGDLQSKIKHKKAFSTFKKEYKIDPNKGSQDDKHLKKNLDWNKSKHSNNSLIDDKLLGAQKKRFPISESRVPPGLRVIVALTVVGVFLFFIIQFFITNYAGHAIY